MQKKTVVIGASENPDRYAYKAIIALQMHKHPVVALGIKNGEINGINIRTDKPVVDDVDTVSLYLNNNNQKLWYDYIIGLKPKRVIFNPGAENDELISLLNNKNINAMEACTLVMLSLGTF
jgi:predicted CoA-binding protein